MATKTLSIHKTETDVAVLQVQVKNIEDKVDEMKENLKDLHDSLDQHSAIQVQMIKDIAQSSASAHKSMSEKISALEKWRWMMMGAGVVMGALGFETLGKLLK